MKLKFRILSVLLAVISILSVFSGCGVIKGDTVMSYGDYEITEAMYSYWMARYKTLFLYAYNNSKDTSSFWVTEIQEGYNYEQFIVDYIDTYAARVLVAMKLFDEFGLKFSESLKDDIDDHVDDLILTYGTRAELETVLGKYGLNIKTLKTIYYAENKLKAVNEYLFGEGGVKAVTDNDREKYYEANYYCFERIYIYTKKQPAKGDDGGYLTDSSGNYKMEELSEERKSDQEAKLSKLYAALAEGKTDFVTLRTKYSDEDLEKFSSYPDGINVSMNDLAYGTDFLKTLKSLEIGSYGSLEDEYGVWIIRRCELKSFAQLTTDELAVMNDFETYVFDAKVEKYYEDYEIIRHEDIIARFDIKTLKGLENTNI